MADKKNRVYDDRTGQTLFTGTNVDCVAWINNHIPEDSEDYLHAWVEPVSQPKDEK